MKKQDWMPLIAFFVIILCAVLLTTFNTQHKKTKNDSINYRILIINKETGDTIFNEKLKLTETDSITPHI